MTRASLGERRLNLFIRSDVDFTKGAANFGSNALAAIRIPVEHRYLGASAGKFACRRFAKSRRPAGHDRRHSVDVHFVSKVAILADAYASNGT
jgi:hypothetical protein